MKTRAPEACQILNKHHYLGYDDWKIHHADLGACYLSAGKDGVERFITMYEAMEAAIDLEIEATSSLVVINED